MDEEILEPADRIKKIKAVNPVSIVKRFGNPTKPNTSPHHKDAQSANGDNKQNKAHKNPEHVGEQVDYNV